jgi:Tol biopolymer transport system component
VTRRGARRATTDPYGLAPVAAVAAPIAAFLGLVIVALVSLVLLGVQLPGGGPSNPGGGVANPNRTPAPSNVVVVPEPKLTYPGSIVYAKAGNIWLQSDQGPRQITNSGRDAMPAWAPDGKWIYFVRQTTGRGQYPLNGRRTWYDIDAPQLIRVRPDGTGEEVLLTGRYTQGKNTWFYWIRDPAVSPDGHTIALVSDGPDPNKSDVVVQLFDTETKKLTKPKLPENAPLGHQDPAWRSDGAVLAFVRNGRDGSRGAPQILRYATSSKKVGVGSAPGYLSPSFSPDGRFMAATRTGGVGTDVVILDAGSGAEVLRLTRDDKSFSPVWSPAGGAIVYLRIDGHIVDLMMARLEGGTGAWRVAETVPLTELSGLDAGSKPSWFVPPDELPAKPSAAPAGSGIAAPSTAPSSAP